MLLHKMDFRRFFCTVHRFRIDSPEANSRQGAGGTRQPKQPLNITSNHKSHCFNFKLVPEKSREMEIFTTASESHNQIVPTTLLLCSVLFRIHWPNTRLSESKYAAHHQAYISIKSIFCSVAACMRFHGVRSAMCVCVLLLNFN